ncbi:MAG: response regulator transcription factor [Flavobacteriaceae bacterium]|nr:response regulator transcription factor [Flavobacteriaceae bacterium]
MKCIVVDDEETSRAIMAHLIDINPRTVLIDSFDDAISAIKYLNEHPIDLIFLNIHMPTFTGFDFLKTIKTPPNIILTSSDNYAAHKAFDYECIVDFFSKPISQDRFDKGVQRAISTVGKNFVTSKNLVSGDSIDDLYVNIDRRLVKINIPSINLIVAQGDYIMLKTAGKNYMVYSTLKKIGDKLPTDAFLKVHRSYIINTKKIIDIEDNSVLIGEDVVPVSRSNRPELIKRLNLL